MMRTLATFAALSMAGTVILSLLPEGGLKRTAGMAVGLLTLMCWAEGIAALLGLDMPDVTARSILVPTAISVENAELEASSILSARWEGTP